MKQTRLLVLLGLLIVGSVVAAVTPPTDLSLRGIVEWVGVGGHIASGTSFPAVGAKGSRFTDLSNPNRAVDYRSNGAYWKPTATWNHALLDNLVYASSGHGPVPMSYGGTGGTSSETARESLDVFSKASTTALIDDLSGVTEVASARENIDVYSIEETNQLIAQTVALLRYYVSSEPADLPGFGSLNSVASTTEASFTTPALTTTMTQVTQRITAVGQPNISQTVAGIYPFSVNLQRSGGKLAYFQVALFKRDTGGSETHIASSSVYTLTDDLRKTVTLGLLAPSTVAWASTDRLVLRSYAAKESTGVAVDIAFYYGDGNQSYITLSAGGGGVYARQDLHNVDPLTGRQALGFPDSTGRANYVLAVGTDTDELYWAAPGAGTSEAGRNMVVWDELNLRSGTHTQTEFSLVQLRMNQIPGRMSDYPSVKMSEFIRGYLLQLEDVAGVYPASGSYLCAQKDLGAVKNCSLDSVFEATLGSGTATFEYRVSSDGSAWTNWTEVSPTTVECRYMEFRASLTSTDPAQTPTITSFLETVKLLGLDAYGSGCPVYASDGLLGGTWVPFGYTFTSTPSVVLNAVGSGTYAGIVSTTNQGFYVSVKDSSGAFINGVIDWIAKGY